MKSKQTLATFPLAHTKKGVISVTHLEDPYGPGSGNVVSVGISLKGDAEEPDWKAHIPYENLDAVIAALQDARKRFGA